MTLVVTHAAGFLACFTRNPDGTMRQRALIDTGEEPPTALELADIGERLSKEYGWNGQAVAVNPVKAMKAKPKALPQKRSYTQSDLPVPERKARMLAYLGEHPHSTLKELIEGMGFEADHGRTQRWYFQIRDLLENGDIIRRKGFRGGYKVTEYSVM
jgi:hypothetical protein